MTRPDWTWVQEWFEDETLNRELGPLDTEWLDYVLAETEGAQLVIVDGDDSPVALVGCAWDSDRKAHGITDIAVDPRRRRSSLGRHGLDCAIRWSGHPPAAGWVAFVHPDNAPAFRFFTSIGWKYEGLDDSMHRFSSPS
ncbi:GNAT family N-acetyltransferase [Nocardia panacis]|uniref:GNAT family N-acetyltransferase n=2 Tax=Nocardia panacis TaxID=2340916 RepID=A0A3A4KP30_9NOCA|nr:GNAT family N-acetyltransferase [Nocardia panacis]